MSTPALAKGAPSAGFTVTLLLILAGLVPIVVQAMMLAQIHPPNFDEVYFASASASVANGGPPEAWMQFPRRVATLSHFYGPLWFWLEGSLFRWFGVSIYVGRALSLAGLLFLAAAAAAVIRASGAPRSWAAAGFALAVWMPSLPVPEGRMDAIAQALGIAGLAAVVVAVRRGASSAGLAATAGGVAFGLAVLATPRAGLTPVAMALASPVLIVFGFDRRRVGVTVAIAATTAMVATTVGLQLAGVSWSEWFDALREGGIGSADASPLLGGRSYLGNASRMAPAPLFFAVLAGIALLCEAPRQVRGMAAFVTTFAACCTVLTFLLFSDPFARTTQFVYAWLVAGVIAAATLLAHRRRIVVAALAVLALGCVGLRVNRYIEVAQSWDARDPRSVETFLRTHVPAGATVYTGSAYYFAVRSAGLRVRAFTARLRVPWSPTAEPLSAGPGYVLVPDPDLENRHAPRPGTECLTSATLVAVFTPAPVPTTGLLAHIPAFYQPTATRGYSRTLLYLLPDGCILE